jgi:hypothetical protein
MNANGNFLNLLLMFDSYYNDEVIMFLKMLISLKNY